MSRFTRILLLVPLLLISACDDSGGTRRGDRDVPGGTTTPTPLPEPTTIEFRVLGNPSSLLPADIRWSTTQEGTSLVTTQLPWTTRVRTLEQSSFLTLTARQTSFDPISFLHVQILVNDRVFREASAPGPDASVSIAGTFQR